MIQYDILYIISFIFICNYAKFNYHINNQHINHHIPILEKKVNIIINHIRIIKCKTSHSHIHECTNELIEVVMYLPVGSHSRSDALK